MELSNETIQLLRNMGIRQEDVVSTEGFRAKYSPFYMDTRFAGPFMNISIFLGNDVDWVLVKDQYSAWCLIPISVGVSIAPMPYTLLPDEIEVTREVLEAFSEFVDIEEEWEEKKTACGKSYVDIFDAIMGKLQPLVSNEIKREKVFDTRHNIFTC